MAGFASKAFTHKFMEKDSILLLPDTVTMGFVRQKQSEIALKYMSWLESKNGMKILKGIDGTSEVIISGLKVDGFVEETLEVIEINGCFWHRCLKVKLRITPENILHCCFSVIKLPYSNVT